AGYGATWAAPIASLMMEKYLKDTISAERLPEIDRLANADLVPDAIKHWYYKQDSIKLAKQSQKINPDAAPVFQNNLETTKPVQFDPEAEPNRKDNGDTTTKVRKDMLKPEEQRNRKPH